MDVIFNPLNQHGIQDYEDDNNRTQKIVAIDEHGHPLLDAEDNLIHIPAPVVAAQVPQDPHISVRPPAPVNDHMHHILNQTIVDFDTPHQYFQDCAAIHHPQPQTQDYKIKPQINALVKHNQLHGLTTEHPMDYIKLFYEICSTTKSNGVPPDNLKCKFSHCL